MVLWKKNYETVPRATELRFRKEKHGRLSKNFQQIFYLLWENYGTMLKTMVLYRKLWNFDLL